MKIHQWNSFLNFKKLNLVVLDTLFPIACLACQKKNFWLCSECTNKLTLLSFQLCPYCEKEITRNGQVCEKCKQSQFLKNQFFPLDGLVCATEYQSIAKFVHLFKYNFVSDLGIPLGKIIVRILQKNNCPLPDIIIPIPIHRRKLKWRGFNQAEILADVISQNWAPGLPLSIQNDLIFRQKKTRAQMKIKTYKERLANLHDAFALTLDAKKIIPRKKILLVDDIATTGATLFECAKILKASGAKEVTGAIIARQKI
jgi:ComF family protein